MTHIQGAVAAKTVLQWQGIIPSARVRLPLVAATAEEETMIKADLAVGHHHIPTTRSLYHTSEIFTESSRP